MPRIRVIFPLVLLATLAAAYAEAGRFAEAVAANDEARRVAEKAGRPDLLESLIERGALYDAERPYRAEAR